MDEHDCDHPYCPEYGDYTEHVGDQVFHVCWKHVHWAREGGQR